MIWTKPPWNYVQNINLQGCTLPKTNIALKLEPWKRRFLLETTIFRCKMLVFRGVFALRLGCLLPWKFNRSPLQNILRPLKGSHIRLVAFVLKSSYQPISGGCKAKSQSRVCKQLHHLVEHVNLDSFRKTQFPYQFREWRCLMSMPCGDHMFRLIWVPGNIGDGRSHALFKTFVSFLDPFCMSWKRKRRISLPTTTPVSENLGILGVDVIITR